MKGKLYLKAIVILFVSIMYIVGCQKKTGLQAQTFMLSGEIPFTVSDSEKYGEDEICSIAESLINDEYYGGMFALSYEESQQEAWIEEVFTVSGDKTDIPGDKMIALKGKYAILFPV